MDSLATRITEYLQGRAEYDPRKLLTEARAALNVSIDAGGCAPPILVGNPDGLTKVVAEMRRLANVGTFAFDVLRWADQIEAARYASTTQASGSSQALGAMVDAVELPDDAEPAPVVPTELTGDDRILWGVVANAGRLSDTRTFRWAHIMDATGLGSTSAEALCRRFGFNPDDRQGGEVPDSEPGECDHANGICRLNFEHDAAATAEPLKLAFEYDNAADVLTIEGIRYHGGMFRSLSGLPVGEVVRIKERKDGVLVLTQENDLTVEPTGRALLAQAEPTMLGVLTLRNRQMQEALNEYVAARDEYDDATRPPNSHAQPRQLKHGDPRVLRLACARAALNALVLGAGLPLPIKCDGNHGGPRCGDPECWNDDPEAYDQERPDLLRKAIANTRWSEVPLDKLKGVADVLCSFAAPKEKLCAVSIDLPLSEADREELKDLPVGKVLGPKHGDDGGDGLRYVLCKVGLGDHWANWLFIPHADGQYVSAAKLAPFSVSIIRSALAGVPL